MITTNLNKGDAKLYEFILIDTECSQGSESRYVVDNMNKYSANPNQRRKSLITINEL